MPSLTFKCEETGGNKLKVTILNCKNLPDLDGAFDCTDAYVKVKLGEEKKWTETDHVGGSLDPEFKKEDKNVFEFTDVSVHSRIRFEVWDKDNVSKDDLIGKASIQLSKKYRNGEEIMLELLSPSDGETHLSRMQTTEIYKLFRVLAGVLDSEKVGKLDPSSMSLTADKESKAALLLSDLKALVADTDSSKDVSFGEFLEQFRVNETTGDSSDINKLTEEIKTILTNNKGA